MGESREVLNRSAAPPPLTVRYGSHPDQLADVWPASSRQPAARRPPPALVVFVHGGFWRVAYDRLHVRPLANDLASHGYTVAAIEYRRVNQPGGGWPGSFDDVALAVDTLPSLLEAEGLAVGPVVLAGHSAGGHLALWCAVRHRLPEEAAWRRATPPPITAVLALAPVADLRDAYRRNLGEDAVGELLGGAPDAFPARYAAVDTGTLPVPDVPTVLVHGTRDDRVPVEQSRRYAARGVRLVEIREAEHFGLIDPLSQAWPRVLDALRELADPGGPSR